MHEKLYEMGSEGDALPENAAPWWLKVRERWPQRKEELESWNVDLGCFDLGCFFLDPLVLNENLISRCLSSFHWRFFCLPK